MALIFGIDTETVGGFGNPRMVQVAALLYNDVDDRIEAQIDTIIAPGEHALPIDPTDQAIPIHGIDQQRIEAYGLPAPMVCNLILRMVSMADSFMAYNETFDHRVLLAVCEAIELPIDRLKNMKRICVMKLCAEACKMPPTDAMAATGRLTNKNPKLAEAYEILLGTPLVGAHNAFTDLRATLQLYRQVTRGQA